MNKYDFGYVIQQGTTVEWAIGKIKRKSKILELGPSNGNLTKHLKEDFECVVDIIEINEEAGSLASNYARHAFIGYDEGNIEGFKWYKKLKDERYDYIIILDVLEHLIHTDEVLDKLKNILKQDGSILISMPNIAHNSVLIDLINNKFNYSDLGLLDNTHVKFFTYTTLCQVFYNIDMVAVDKQCIIKGVGDNEIRNSYDQIDSSLAYALRKRSMSDVYQFLFEFKNKNFYKEDKSFFPDCADITKNRIDIYIQEEKDDKFDEEKVIRTYVDFENINVDIDLTSYSSIKKIRIDLLGVQGILSDYQLSSTQNNKKDDCILEETNGFFLNKKEVVWNESALQLVYNVEDIKDKYLNFTARISEASSSVCNNIIQFIKQSIVETSALEELNKLQELYKVTEVERARVTKDYILLEQSRDELEKIYKATEAERARVTKDYRLLEESRNELEKIYEVVKEEKDRIVREYNELNSAYCEEINHLKQIQMKNDENIKQLNNALNDEHKKVRELSFELNTVYDSKGWKLLNSFRSVRKFIKRLLRR